MQTVYIYHANGNGLAYELLDVETPEEVLNSLEELCGVQIEEDSTIWLDKALQVHQVMWGYTVKCRIGDYLVCVTKF